MVKRAEFVGDREPYIVLRDRWFNIFVLKENATTEEKSDEKRQLFEKLQHVFNYVPRNSSRFSIIFLISI